MTSPCDHAAVDDTNIETSAAATAMRSRAPESDRPEATIGTPAAGNGVRSWPRWAPLWGTADHSWRWGTMRCGWDPADGQHGNMAGCHARLGGSRSSLLGRDTRFDRPATGGGPGCCGQQP